MSFSTLYRGIMQIYFNNKIVLRCFNLLLKVSGNRIITLFHITITINTISPLAQLMDRKYARYKRIKKSGIVMLNTLIENILVFNSTRQITFEVRILVYKPVGSQEQDLDWYNTITGTKVPVPTAFSVKVTTPRGTDRNRPRFYIAANIIDTFFGFIFT